MLRPEICKHHYGAISFDSLFGASASVVTQPALGRIADASGYPLSYLCSAAIQAVALPFLGLARRERSDADGMEVEARED